MSEPEFQDEEFTAAPQAFSSAEAREICDKNKAALLSALEPQLSDLAQPLNATELKEAVLELDWLQVAKNQVSLMLNAHSELSELQRTLRTATRRESAEAELTPSVTRLLHKAAGHLQNASQDVRLWQPSITIGSTGEDARFQITVLEDGQRRVSHPTFDDVAETIVQKLTGCYEALALRWSQSLSKSLLECGWPPTPPPESPDGPAPEITWQGFHTAPEASVAAMQNAFVALLALQSARGMHDAVPAASGGPWAPPELRAVTELVAAPVHMLEEAFLSGGPFDRPDATVWIFQAATRALESLPEAVQPLQATLDASMPEWQYSIGFEAVRCMHAEVCRLLIRRRLPSLSEAQWVALVDECMEWERMVLPAMGCVLPEDATLIAPNQLYGSLLSRVYTEEPLRQKWWAAESSSAASAASSIVISADDAVWAALDESEHTDQASWQKDVVFTGVSSRMHALLARLFTRCMWLGAAPTRILMVQVVLGAAIDEYLKVVNRLLTKCKAFDDILSGSWLQRLCSYSTSSRALLSACQDLLASAAFSPLPPADDATTAATLTAMHASSSPVTVGSSRGMLRGALNAGLSAGLNVGHSAVASLSGLFSGALPAALDRLAPTAGASYSARSAVGSSAHAGGAAPTTAGVSGGPGSERPSGGASAAALLLQPQQQNLEALAAACSAEAAQAVGSAAVGRLTTARNELRAGRIQTASDVPKAVAPAVGAIQDGLQRLSKGLDRTGFQTAMRSIARKLDEAISSELKEAAHSGGLENSSSVFDALCQEVASGFKPYSRKPEAMFKLSCGKRDPQAPFPAV